MQRDIKFNWHRFTPKDLMRLNTDRTLDIYVVAGDPLMHALTATVPKGGVNCIRLIFNADFVHFFFSEDAIDMNDIATEVSDELYRREYANRQMDARREQRIAEIQKKRN